MTPNWSPNWEASFVSRQARTTHRVPWTRNRLRMLKVGLVAGLLPVTALICAQALTYTKPARLDVAPQPVGQGPDGTHGLPIHGVDLPNDPTDLALHIAMATEAREWPEFSIPMDELEDAKVTEWTDDNCIDISDADLERCTYDGPADRLVLVLGDSVAVSWVPALRTGLAPEGYAIATVAKGQCPAAHVTVSNNAQQEGFTESCDAFQQWAAEVVDEMQPDVVVLSSAENSLRRLSSGASGDARSAEWAQGTSLAIRAVEAEGRHVVVLAPPPTGSNLQGCVSGVNGPAACTSTIGQEWLDQREAERQATEDVSATYIDSSEWFCRPDGVCPAFVGDLPIRADGTHLTAGYATKLGPQLRDALLTGSVAGDALEG